LAAKALETVRLTEVLSVSPEDEEARAALGDHLAELRQSAAERGLAHLEAAIAEVLSQLERESFGPTSLVAARVLAWRYESLAAMPSQSGTHPVARPPAELSLRGRRVLVADDQAEVRWFYVRVLREASARVIEARDGVHALELARGQAPDLILADIVMPRLDGLGLCAAVRRDPALDGVPVVLLSWRDDFLHRMRELGAEAQDYLRKEVPAREILERAFHVLEPLTQLEDSLTGDREAHGDLEKLGVSALLRATRRLRPSANIVLQDPWSLFDLELRDGHIIEASRTAIDGAITRGEAAFPALVGMSSGRFVVAEPVGRPSGEQRASLDASFVHATRRLGVLLSTMAAHPDCHVEFDEDVLGTYVRHSPTRVQGLIARLDAGEPPHALWDSGAASRSLVDALLVTLARQGAIKDVTVPRLASDVGPPPNLSPGPSRALNEPEIQQDSSPVIDPLEREDIRAQSAVAMHRESANHASERTYPIWRLNVDATAESAESGSGFGVELQTTPRLLGLGFAVLLSATVGFLIWRQVMPDGPPSGSPADAVVQAAGPEAQLAVDAPAAPAGGLDLSAFAGGLRAGVDPSLAVAEGEGVLDVTGPTDVGVAVDGIDKGTLPVTVVLEQGTHAVQYRVGGKSTYRFYYVKSGATRVLRVVTQPGGFVDAR
jgi:CheY-like chemotaxis protein